VTIVRHIWVDPLYPLGRGSDGVCDNCQKQRQSLTPELKQFLKTTFFKCHSILHVKNLVLTALLVVCVLPFMGAFWSSCLTGLPKRVSFGKGLPTWQPDTVLSRFVPLCIFAICCTFSLSSQKDKNSSQQNQGKIFEPRNYFVVQSRPTFC
jgi:hypothetical protein